MQGEQNLSEREVFKIVNEHGGFEGAYSRACHTEYEFGSVSEARRSNVHGVFKDKRKYKIARYKVTYTLIEEDADPMTDEERVKFAQKTIEEKALEPTAEELAEVERRGMTHPMAVTQLRFAKMIEAQIFKAGGEFARKLRDGGE